jgi:ribosomal protein S27AE
MTASGRVIGLILIAVGVIIGVLSGLWLLSGMSEGNLRGSGALFGAAFLFLVVVAPLVGGGIFFVTRGRAEEQATARARAQRRLLDMVSTRGKISIIDIAQELKLSRGEIEGDLYDLVGMGLFTGYVDWNKGVLQSVEAARLQGEQHCPNCGGILELAGKGLVKCPYCGAEIFLGPDGAKQLAQQSANPAISSTGGQR